MKSRRKNTQPVKPDARVPLEITAEERKAIDRRAFAVPSSGAGLRPESALGDPVPAKFRHSDAEGDGDALRPDIARFARAYDDVERNWTSLHAEAETCEERLDNLPSAL